MLGDCSPDELRCWFMGIGRLRKWAWAVFQLFRGRGTSADLFDLNYFLRRDPWKYNTSGLEQGKYRDILSLVPADTGAALEVGCAEGVFTQMLSKQVTSLLGIDSSPVALGRARKACPTADFQQMDISRQSPESEYDLIVASEILYYMGDSDQISRVGRRMLEWLKPDGYLLLCHMRSQSDESEGFPRPRWTPSHPGAFTVHGIFDAFDQLDRVSELYHPLYKVSLYRKI